MSNTENLGPEYHKDKNKNRLKGKRVVWSRRKSSPWTFTMLIIFVLIIAAGAVAVTYLVTSHPGKPQQNPTIDTPVQQ